MTDRMTPLAAAADAILRTQGYNLADWLADRRDEGTGLRQIAQQLTDQLDWHQRPVSHQTVANWLEQYATHGGEAA